MGPLCGRKAYVFDKEGAVDNPRVFMSTRILSLDGGINFRDLGGYATEDGRRVVWRRLFRSGSPHRLTDGDWAILAELGVGFACDLRGNAERSKTPSGWAMRGVQVAEWDYEMHEDSFRKFFDHGPPNTADLIAFMRAFYVQLPDKFGNRFKHLVDELLAQPERGVVVHCAAGKDRTGILCALLLTALGVPRETVIEDYHLTEAALPMHFLLQSLLERDDSSWSFIKDLPQDMQAILLGAPKEMIEAAIDHIERQYGNVLTWMESELAIGGVEIEALRVHFTE